MSQDSGSQKPTPDQIVSALRQTGFLLEHYTAHRLRALDFTVTINDAFPDPDSGKSREIDVLGQLGKELYHDNENIDYTIVTSEVIVECKNSPNPLVLVGTNVEKWGPVDDALVVTFDPYSLSFPDTDFKTIDGELHLKRLPGYGPKAAFVGHQLVRMNRASGNWKADNSAVYDSILYPLVKAREYRKLQHSYQVDKEPYDIAIWRFPRFVYLFPVAERR